VAVAANPAFPATKSVLVNIFFNRIAIFCLRLRAFMFWVLGEFVATNTSDAVVIWVGSAAWRSALLG
jgi:hypothetical protein